MRYGMTKQWGGRADSWHEAAGQPSGAAVVACVGRDVRLRKPKGG
jgi:hypothetical protein